MSKISFAGQGVTTGRSWHTVLVVAALTAVCAQPGLATEHEVGAYGSTLTTCYAKAVDRSGRQACMGQMAQLCMDSQDGGHTTLGMSSCLNAEAQVWDQFLNDEYTMTMASSKALDVDEAEYFPEFAKRAEHLRAAQRAWIAFRDAECALAYAQWGSGSMRSIAYADCMMTMTGTRALELRAMREEGE